MVLMKVLSDITANHGSPSLNEDISRYRRHTYMLKPLYNIKVRPCALGNQEISLTETCLLMFVLTFWKQKKKQFFFLLYMYGFIFFHSASFFF